VRSPNLIAEVCIKGKWRKLFRLEQTKTPHSRPGGGGGYHQFFIKQIKRRQGYLETSDEVNQKVIEEIILRNRNGEKQNSSFSIT
jgi:hypothetical protein